MNNNPKTKEEKIAWDIATEFCFSPESEDFVYDAIYEALKTPEKYGLAITHLPANDNTPISVQEIREERKEGEYRFDISIFPTKEVADRDIVGLLASAIPEDWTAVISPIPNGSPVSAPIKEVHQTGWVSVLKEVNSQFMGFMLTQYDKLPKQHQQGIDEALEKLESVINEMEESLPSPPAAGKDNNTNNNQK